MPRIFITATGTDIGKTFVTAGLIRCFRARGLDVAALKPVISGFDPLQAAASDTGRLASALGRALDMDELDRISLFRFRAPLSPDMAAEREGREIDFRAVLDSSPAPDANGWLFVEGAGGVMAPLDARHTMLDWMAALGSPVVLVAGSYLGTISHTLTALSALRGRAVPVAAIVISQSVESPVPLDETAAAIARFVKPAPVFSFPRLNDEPETCSVFGDLADHLISIVNGLKIS